MGRKLNKQRTRNEVQDAMLRQARQFGAYQRLRISVSNQMAAMVRQGLISEDELTGMFGEHLREYKRAEDAAADAAAEYLPGLPVWEQWLKHVRGIAAKLAGPLVAMVQPIYDFETVSKLWAYACDVPGEDGRVRVRKGEQPHHCADLKRQCYLIVKQFIKDGKQAIEKGKPTYRVFYDRYKARDAEKHAADMAKHLRDVKAGKAKAGGQWSKAHMEARVIRYTYKLFLSHLWQVMRELEGLPIRMPYVVEKLGHTGYVSPWTMVDLPAAKPKRKPKARKRNKGGDEKAA